MLCKHKALSSNPSPIPTPAKKKKKKGKKNPNSTLSKPKPRAEGTTQEVGCLPSKCKGVKSNPITAQNRTKQKIKVYMGRVEHTCNSSTGEAEGGSQVPSLGYVARP
jgi:hypothetical protein